MIPLQRDDYSNILGHLLALRTFLCSLEKASKSASVLLQPSLYMVQQIFDQVSWQSLRCLLNKEAFEEFRHDQVLSFHGFYQSGEQPLPEDWGIRGLIWTADHFPSTWFDDTRDLEIEDQIREEHLKCRIQRVTYLARSLCLCVVRIFILSSMTLLK